MRITAVILFSAFAFGSGGQTASTQSAPQLVARVDARDHFSQEEVDRSKLYNQPRRTRALIALLLGVLLLALLAFGSVSRTLASRAEAVTGGRAWLAGAVIGAAIALGTAILSLPFGLIALRHERAFGLATQGVPGFLLDRAKGLGFELILAALVGAVLVALGRAMPTSWPAVASFGAASLTVALVFVFPLLYEPAFNRFTPAPEPIAQRVERIAQASGVSIGEVLIVDASRRTTKHNAYVSGLGPTRRVVLYDTLVKEAPAAEVDLVVAHELAHVRHGDVLRGTWLGSLAAILGIGALFVVLRVAAVPASSPRAVAIAAFVFSVGSLLAAPISNGLSRSWEARADATAIDVVAQQTDDLAATVETAVALEVTLARSNIADLAPPRWVVWAFASHPPVLERIGAAIARGEAR